MEITNPEAPKGTEKLSFAKDAIKEINQTAEDCSELIEKIVVQGRVGETRSDKPLGGKIIDIRNAIKELKEELKNVVGGAEMVEKEHSEITKEQLEKAKRENEQGGQEQEKIPFEVIKIMKEFYRLSLSPDLDRFANVRSPEYHEKYDELGIQRATFDMTPDLKKYFDNGFMFGHPGEIGLRISGGGMFYIIPYEGKFYVIEEPLYTMEHRKSVYGETVFSVDDKAETNYWAIIKPAIAEQTENGKWKIIQNGLVRNYSTKEAAIKVMTE